jgi:hypothetical protein
VLNRRFTLLTNSYRTPTEYQRAALVEIFFYNFCRKHSTLKGKPLAMAAGITSTGWSVRDMLFRCRPKLAEQATA